MSETEVRVEWRRGHRQCNGIFVARRFAAEKFESEADAKQYHRDIEAQLIRTVRKAWRGEL